MAVDLETVEHSWLNADGSVPDGEITFTLSSQMDGATEATTVGTQPVISTLILGVLSQQLVPNVNADLSPNGTYYTVFENIIGATPISYPITVPSGSGPYDLWELRSAS